MNSIRASYFLKTFVFFLVKSRMIITLHKKLLHSALILLMIHLVHCTTTIVQQHLFLLFFLSIKKVVAFLFKKSSRRCLIFFYHPQQNRLLFLVEQKVIPKCVTYRDYLILHIPFFCALHSFFPFFMHANNPLESPLRT